MNVAVRRPCIVIALCCIILLLTSTPGSAAPNSNDYWPTRGWRSTAPEEQGMNSGRLADMMESIRERKLKIDSITIVRNGYMVLDACFYPFPKNRKHNLRSCSKSVMSALIGIAIDKGYIEGVHQPVLSFFPEKTAAHPDENKKRMTIENLLTMTTGLDCQDGYRFKNRGLFEMFRSSDWAGHVLDLPMAGAPGERFEYCNGATYLLSAILQKATGMRSLDFAGKHLFAPLGITDASWDVNSQGVDWGFGRLWLTPHDMAKIGWLYLHEGQWDGVRVIPAAWVDASRRGRVPVDVVTSHYGYLWWVDKEWYTAVGSKGQYIFVAPKENIVAVFTGSMSIARPYVMIRVLFENHILASAASLTPLPDNPGDRGRLNGHLAAVETPPAAKPKSLSPLPKMSETVSGRVYTFDPNTLGLNSLVLTFTPSADEAEMKLEMRGRTRRLAVGLDDVPRITEVGGKLYAYKGAWESDNVFTYTFDYVDDATWGNARLEFKGGELSFQVHDRTSGRSYDALGRFSEEKPDDGKQTDRKSKLTAALEGKKGLSGEKPGQPERTPDEIEKADIVYTWKG
ncbi:MAG: serine hydrolase, partial [Desulfobacterales bacterium]|nr:serine hydrolase [Desulfobacterales bacterium]